jgi:hypothetical protein
LFDTRQSCLQRVDIPGGDEHPQTVVNGLSGQRPLRDDFAGAP